MRKVYVIVAVVILAVVLFATLALPAGAATPQNPDARALSYVNLNQSIFRDYGVRFSFSYMVDVKRVDGVLYGGVAEKVFEIPGVPSNVLLKYTATVVNGEFRGVTPVIEEGYACFVVLEDTGIYYKIELSEGGPGRPILNDWGRLWDWDDANDVWVAREPVWGQVEIHVAK